MIRYTLFFLAVIATAATALAAVHPGPEVAETSRYNVTVIQKNDPFPVFGPLVVEQCVKEDCSDVQF